MRTEFRLFVPAAASIWLLSCGVPDEEKPQPSTTEQSQGATSVSSPCSAKACPWYYAQYRSDGKLTATSDAEKADSSACCSKGASDEILTDCCGKTYGEVTTYFMGYPAQSNAACTNGDGGGKYQCLQFIKDVIVNVFRRPKRDWAMIDVPQALGRAETDPNDYGGDDLFVFRCDRSGFSGCAEALQVGDAIMYNTHTVIVAEIIERSPDNRRIYFRVVEQNVAKNPESCNTGYRRQMHIVWDDSVSAYTLYGGADESAGKLKFLGFLRHNVSGIFSDGWHEDGTSQAFRSAYTSASALYGKKPGWGFDNGGSPFVHTVCSRFVQDIKNTDPNTANHFGTDGRSLIISNKAFGGLVYIASLVHDEFLGAMSCAFSADCAEIGGLGVYGAPKSDQLANVQINDQCEVVTSGGLAVDWYQNFDKACMWMKGDKTVHVHFTAQSTFAVKENCGPVVKKEDKVVAGSGTITIATIDEDCTVGTPECNGTSAYNQCVRDMADNTVHWLTMNCAAGMICSNGSCITPPATPTGTATATATATATPIGVCTDGAIECTGNTSYRQCVRDATSGTVWWNMVCDTGKKCDSASKSCVPDVPPPPPSVPGDVCQNEKRECTGPNTYRYCVRISANDPTYWLEKMVCPDGYICDSASPSFCSPLTPSPQPDPGPEPAPEPQTVIVPDAAVDSPLASEPDTGTIATATGGNMSMGGSIGTGGAVDTGGVVGTGGVSRTGGIVGSGGVVDTGGTFGAGGVTETGGSVGFGGVMESGGLVGSGGAGTGGIIGTGGIVGTGGLYGSGGAIGTGGVVASGGTNATGGTGGMANPYAVYAVDGPTSITLVADPLRMPHDPCWVGNLPDIDWGAGTPLVSGSDGLARVSFAKSSLSRSLPYADCIGNGLPYRFNIKTCGSNTADAWFTADMFNAGPLYWWGLDDGSKDNPSLKCHCAGGLALALSSTGALVTGDAFRRNCDSY